MTNTKNEEFGTMLRRLREASGKSMGALARHLGHSVPYLSDIERNQRGALGAQKIQQAAEFLEVSAQALLVAAAQERSVLDVPESVSPEAMEVGVQFASAMHRLDDDQLREIQKILAQGEE